MHGQQHMPTWTCTQSDVAHTHTHTDTHSHIHTQAPGPGLNRFNSSSAGSGNPIQVTRSKESKASRGGLMMTKQGWRLLTGTVSRTWVGLQTGEDAVSGACWGWGAEWRRERWGQEMDGWIGGWMDGWVRSCLKSDSERECNYF